MVAAEGGNLDIVELLLNKGADVKVKSNYGKFLILLCRDNSFLTTLWKYTYNLVFFIH